MARGGAKLIRRRRSFSPPSQSGSRRELHLASRFCLGPLAQPSSRRLRAPAEKRPTPPQHVWP
eukprot:6153395-Alexandrium_andersonii.AAC.1